MNDEENDEYEEPEYIIGVKLEDGSKFYTGGQSKKTIDEFKKALVHNNYIEWDNLCGPPKGFSDNEHIRTGFPVKRIMYYRITFDYGWQRRQFEKEGYTDL